MKNLVKGISLFEAYSMLFVLGVLAIMLFLGDHGSAHAALLTPSDAPNEVPVQEVRPAIVNLVNYILTFLGLLAVIMIIYAGFLMLTAGGDEKQVGKAKTLIIWAGVGIIIILLSYAIVSFFVQAGNGIAGGTGT